MVHDALEVCVGGYTQLVHGRNSYDVGGGGQGVTRYIFSTFRDLE